MRPIVAQSSTGKLVTKEGKRMRDLRQERNHLAQEEAKVKMVTVGGDHQLRINEVALVRSVLIVHLLKKVKPKISESSPRTVDEKHQ